MSLITTNFWKEWDCLPMPCLRNTINLNNVFFFCRFSRANLVKTWFRPSDSTCEKLQKAMLLSKFGILEVNRDFDLCGKDIAEESMQLCKCTIIFIHKWIYYTFLKLNNIITLFNLSPNRKIVNWDNLIKHFQQYFVICPIGIKFVICTYITIIWTSSIILYV